LCSVIPNDFFYLNIAALLDTDPYFFQGYHEMLWGAEEINDPLLYKEILLNGFTYCCAMMQNENLRNHWRTYATPEDYEALNELLKIVSAYKEISRVKRAIAYGLLRFAPSLLPLRTIRSKVDDKFLKKVYLVDAKEMNLLVNEIHNTPPYWWQVNTKRQRAITHHQHTHAIILRKIPKKSIAYRPVDGVHESSAEDYANRFPVAHDLVIRLSKQFNVGLGRVAIVRMKPQSQAYRHCDGEPELYDRNRYHLVVSCGSTNMLESGNQKEFVKPGEVWLFDNIVMHRAHNLSDQPRIHIIFDGYPLPEDSR
jgi:hypothetical protein